jgi:molecular chaperone GrpE
MPDQTPDQNPENSDFTPGGDGPGLSALQDQLAAAIADRDANYEKLLRTAAEFENYRRRVNKERDEDRKFAPYSLIRDILPSLDNLRRAVEAAKTAGGTESVVQGVTMVLKQIDEVFERNGAKPIVSVGQPFDPNLHEAIAQIPSPDHPSMTVLQEAERGYTLHDRVIRPSKVLVSTNPNG